MNQNQNAGAIGAEQDADLRALEMLAAEDAGAPAIDAGPSPADPAETWAILPAMVGSTLAIALPELRAAYSPEACRAWGEAMVPVADKYGWSADGLIGPELGLVAASLPFIVATFGAIRAKRAELEKAAPPAPPAEVPGAKTVSFGTVAPA
jgi:hypothetical protein